MIDAHWAMAIGGAVVTAACQVMLKAGAERNQARVSLRLWINPLSIAAYALLFGVTLMNLFALRVVPLRTFVILGPLTLILVTLFSRLFLNERLTARQIVAAAVIAAGIAIFNL
jgi:drug/metabolite transporter (DMT)-like permease